MSASSSTTFGASVALVLEEIRSTKDLHQSARRAKLQFATDACLVAHGVRTGYLVDAVHPTDPMQTLTTFLTTLRRKSSIFKNMMLWYHAPTSQSFLVHTSLLQARLAALLGDTGDCVFVRLDKSLSVLRAPPDKLREAIRDVGFTMAKSPDGLSFALSDTFAEEILIPLAAVMVDYPVAYFPAFSGQTSFLEREVLDVYTVSLTETGVLDSTLDVGKGCVLLKFSCPQVLVNNYPELFPGTMAERLRFKFTASLGRAGIGMRVSVMHCTETLDRVAL